MYGHDIAYVNLDWSDRIHLLDVAYRLQSPFLTKLVDKIVITLMMTAYDKLVTGIPLIFLVPLISMLSQYEGKLILQIELWQKLLSTLKFAFQI